MINNSKTCTRNQSLKSSLLSEISYKWLTLKKQYNRKNGQSIRIDLNSEKSQKKLQQREEANNDSKRIDLMTTKGNLIIQFEPYY